MRLENLQHESKSAPTANARNATTCLRFGVDADYDCDNLETAGRVFVNGSPKLERHRLSPYYVRAHVIIETT